MPRKLSERESAALRVILAGSRTGITGRDLACEMTRVLGIHVSSASAHKTAASLVRKNLAWRDGTPKQQNYKISQPGRDAVAGHGITGKWVAR